MKSTQLNWGTKLQIQLQCLLFAKNELFVIAIQAFYMVINNHFMVFMSPIFMNNEKLFSTLHTETAIPNEWGYSWG